MLFGRRLIGWLGSWLALTLIFATITGSVSWIRYYRLVRQGIPTEGLVTSWPDPQNHSFSTYSYKVGSQTFTTKGYPDAAVGQKITVFYLPYDPGVNCPGDPRKLLRTETVPVGMAALLFPTIILVVVYRRLGGRAA